MSNELTYPAADAAGSPPRRRRFALAVIVVSLSVGLAVWLWPRTPIAEPPQPDLAEVDPEVAEAIAAACNKVRQRPRDGDRWGRLGMVFLAHDFFDEANRCFAHAERFDPREPRWPYLHGVGLLLHESDAGIPCLQRAAELCGDDPLAPRLRLARTLLHRGRLDEAALHLEQARKVRPRDPRVQLDLGRLAVLRGQWRQALQHLDACVNDVHTRRLAHTLQAEAWTHLNEPDKARAEQRQAEQAPEDQAGGDPFMEEVLRLQRGLPARLQQASDLLARRQYPQAVQLLEETAERYPRSPAPWLLQGDIWRQLGRPEQAEKAFAEAVRIDPESANAWFHLGCSQAARQRTRAATDSFRRTIRLKPDHADAHFNLANRLTELGDVSAATAEFQAALRCRPDYEPARKALSEMERKK